MHPTFWIAAVALIALAILRVPLNGAAALVAATVVFIGGGLPHGAFDVALLRRAIALDRSALAMAVGGYVAAAIAMAMLWLTLPLAALVLFLTVSAVHFGEDWRMLDEPLLRVAAGAAVIAAPTIGHPAEVTALFIAMSDARAAVVAQIVIAVAPVAVLVSAVGILVVWQDGNRPWAAANTICLMLLLILPPVAGFALFFVFLHSPRHLAEARAALADMTRARWLATGAVLSAAAILGWWGLESLAPAPIGATVPARAFQLLASVALPHLLLARWLETRSDGSPRGRPHLTNEKTRVS